MPKSSRATRYDKPCATGALPTVLVLGDGDFSFSCGLLRHRRNGGGGLTCTSYDTKAQVLQKYPMSGPQNLKDLSAARVTVLHGVDATRPIETLKQSGFEAPASTSASSSSSCMKFDRVVWNFPHTGKQATHANRAVLRDFLTASRALLRRAGQVHITLKLAPPYDRWDIGGEVAEGTGMVLGDELHFDFGNFPGYAHQTTVAGAKNLFDGGEGGSGSGSGSGSKASKGVKAHRCRTFVFVASGQPATHVLSSVTAVEEGGSPWSVAAASTEQQEQDDDEEEDERERKMPNQGDRDEEQRGNGQKRKVDAATSDSEMKPKKQKKKKNKKQQSQASQQQQPPPPPQLQRKAAGPARGGDGGEKLSKNQKQRRAKKWKAEQKKAQGAVARRIDEATATAAARIAAAIAGVTSSAS